MKGSLGVPNNHGTTENEDSRIQDLYEIVVTGNGEPALREQVRSIRRDMDDVLEMKESVKALVKAADVQAGREQEKKTQIDARNRAEGRRAAITNIAIAFLALVVAFMMWRNEVSKNAIQEKLDSQTQTIEQRVAPTTHKPVPAEKVVPGEHDENNR